MSDSRTDELVAAFQAYRALQKHNITEAFKNKDFFALEKNGVIAGNFTFTDSDSIEFTVYTKDDNLYTIELKQEDFKG